MSVQTKPVTGQTPAATASSDKPNPEVKVETPSPEDVEKQADEFLMSFNYTPPVKPAKKEEAKEPPKEEVKEEPKAEVKEEAKEEAKEEPKAGDKPAEAKPEEVKEEEKEEPVDGLLPKPGPKKKAEKAPEQAAPIDEEDLAERTAQKVIERQQADAQQAQDIELDEEDQATLEAVRLMQADPKFKGKDLERETREFWKREEEYIAAWEKENRGSEFDPNDTEHAGFYKKNRLPYSDTDLATGQKMVERARLKAEAMEEVRREILPEVNNLKYESEYRKQHSKINEAQNMAVAELASTVPDFGSLLKNEDGTVKLIDKAIYDQMKEANPLAHELLAAEAAELRVRIEEAEKLARLGQYYQPDEHLEVQVGDTVIKPHAELADVGNRLEQTLLGLPVKERIQDGRTFVTRGQLRQEQMKIVENKNLTREQKQKRLDDLESKHWYITIEDIKGAFVHQSAKKVQRILKTTEKYLGTSKKIEPKTGTTEAPTEAGSTSAKAGESAPPVSAGSSDAVNTKIPGVGGDGKNQYDLTGPMFS